MQLLIKSCKPIFFILILSLMQPFAFAIERVNVSSSGQQGNNTLIEPESLNGKTDLSYDGRFVVFVSADSNLVDMDTNGVEDVFIRDRQNNTTQRVSISSSGEQANKRSFSPYISNNGRYIGFYSKSTNLVDQTVDGRGDYYVHDRDTSTTILITKNKRGLYGHPSYSEGGRLEVFSSLDSSLVDNDTNNRNDVFVRDSMTGSIKRISVSTAGKQGNSDSSSPVISRNGRYVAFASRSTNLVLGNTTNNSRIYIHDLETGTTKVASNLASDGIRSFNGAILPSISDNGRFIAYWGNGNQVTDFWFNHAYIRDLKTGQTKSIDAGLDGENPDGLSTAPSISGNGRVVSFSSAASNLNNADSNGSVDFFVVESDLLKTSDELSVALWPRTHAISIGEKFRSQVFLTNNSQNTLTNCTVDLFNPTIFFGQRIYDLELKSGGSINPLINGSVDIPAGETARIDIVMKLNRGNFEFRDELYLNYSCDSVNAFPRPFVNSLFINSKTGALIAEDYIHLDNNGRNTVVIDRNSTKYWTPYLIRVVNRGDQATSVNLKAYSELSRVKQLRQPQLCEPMDWKTRNWTCSAPRSEEASISLAAGEQKKIMVFLHARDLIEEKPVSNRVFIEAQDQTGAVVSKTSISVSTLD